MNNSCTIASKFSREDLIDESEKICLQSLLILEEANHMEDSGQRLRKLIKDIHSNQYFQQFLKLSTNVQNMQYSSEQRPMRFPIAAVSSSLFQYLDQSYSKLIGFENLPLLLSEYTVRKQNQKHPELKIEDYLDDIQEMLDSFNVSSEISLPSHRTSMIEIVLENRKQYARHHILIFKIISPNQSTSTSSNPLPNHHNPYQQIKNSMICSNQVFIILKLTIKITQDLKQAYLQSLHFVDTKRFMFERKRGRVVRTNIANLFMLDSDVFQYPHYSSFPTTTTTTSTSSSSSSSSSSSISGNSQEPSQEGNPLLHSFTISRKKQFFTNFIDV